MKKIFSAIISSPMKGRLCGLLFALLATTTLWAHDFQSGDLYYNIISDTTVEVTYQAYDSYSNYDGLTSVVIPTFVEYNGRTYSITRIGDDAFLFSSLTSITIPNSVENIGNYAFTACYSLDSIIIPNSVISIGDNAFYNCKNLTSITIPNSVTTIGNKAFKYCSSLISILIPNNVTSIGKEAFYDCDSLTSVEWNAKNCADFDTSSGSPFSHFSRSSPIKSFIFGKEVEYIPACLCHNMDSLTSIIIPNSTTSIGKHAFQGCSFLTSVTIPNSVLSIDCQAFYKCDSLTSITIPESVISIGERAFANCDNLKSIEWNAKNCLGSESWRYFEWSPISSFTFGENVEHIPSELCIYMHSLTSITIPNSVTSIGNDAFYECIFTKENFVNNSTLDAEANNYWGAIIVDVDIDGLLIRNDTVISCRPYVTTVTIPNYITCIETAAFYRCDSLTSITIPESVTSIGGDAFLNTPWYNNLKDGIVILGKVLYKYKGEMPTSTSIDIEKGIVSISAQAFDGCRNLISIYIPETVTSIGDYAFRSCTSLVSVTIPKSITSLGDNTFSECSSLKSVEWNVITCADFEYTNYRPFENSPILSFVFGDSVEYIPAYLCYDMDSLKSIIIPESITSIGHAAFDGCSALQSVSWNAKNYADFERWEWPFDEESPIQSFTFGENVEYIPAHLCYGMDSLISVIWNAKNCADFDSSYETPFSYSPAISSFTFGENVEYIPAYLCYDMDSLRSVTIPNSVDSIGEYTFAYCDSLTFVTIGESVTSIGKYTFNGCDALASITIPNNVKSIGYGAFEYNALKSVTLTAPTVEAYCKGRTNWLLDNNYCTAPRNIRINGKEMTEFVIPNTIDSIYDCQFKYCSSLASVAIPNSVTSIGNSAFYGCDSLSFVIIGSGVTSIGHTAFYDCPIDTVYSRNLTPPQIGSATSAKPFTSKPVCCIPCGATSSYKNSSWKDYMSKFIEGNVYFLNTSVSDPLAGRIETIRELTCDEATFQAIPNVGYEFVQWSDGVTDALRTLDLTQDTTLIAEFRQLFDGKCGDNLYWKHYDDKIIIHGEGAMYDYAADSVPWYQFRDIVKTVEVFDGATSIGNNAFALCKNLNTLTLSGTIENIGENAFAGCTKLYDIYCFAMEPPTAYESSFVNYNAFLHVPCDNQRVYLLDVLFGNFKYIECIEAETATTDTVVVDPSFNDAEFTWPSNNDADTYTLAISKDGEVFCTLTFNANGQLTGIAFAPSRNGQHHAPAATQAANGFTFTVTGLDEGSVYTYDLVIKDSGDNTLQSYSGEFRTQSVDDRTVTVEYDAAQGQVTGAGLYQVGDTVTLTAIPNEGYQFVRWSNEVEDNPYTFVISDNVTLSAEFEEVITTSVENTTPSQQSDTHKLLRNGQLLIIRDGKTYNAMGQEL